MPLQSVIVQKGGIRFLKVFRLFQCLNILLRFLSNLLDGEPLFYAIIQNTDAACSQPVFEKAFISSSNLLLLRQVFPDVERRGDEDDDTDRDILCIGIHTEIL